MSSNNYAVAPRGKPLESPLLIEAIHTLSEMNSALVAKANSSRLRVNAAKLESKEQLAKAEESKMLATTIQSKYLAGMKEMNRERKILLAAIMDLEKVCVEKDPNIRRIVEDVQSMKDYLLSTSNKASVDIQAFKKNMSSGQIPFGTAIEILVQQNAEVKDKDQLTSAEAKLAPEPETLGSIAASITEAEYEHKIAECKRQIQLLEGQVRTTQNDFKASLTYIAQLQKEVEAERTSKESVERLLNIEQETAKLREQRIAHDLDAGKVEVDLFRKQFDASQMQLTESLKALAASEQAVKSLEDQLTTEQRRAGSAERSCLELIEIVDELRKRLSESEETKASQKAGMATILAEFARTNQEQKESLASLQQRYDEISRVLAKKSSSMSANNSPSFGGADRSRLQVQTPSNLMTSASSEQLSPLTPFQHSEYSALTPISASKASPGNQDMKALTASLLGFASDDEASTLSAELLREAMGSEKATSQHQVVNSVLADVDTPGYSAAPPAQTPHEQTMEIVDAARNELLVDELVEMKNIQRQMQRKYEEDIIRTRQLGAMREKAILFDLVKISADLEAHVNSLRQLAQKFEREGFGLVNPLSPSVRGKAGIRDNAVTKELLMALRSWFTKWEDAKQRLNSMSLGNSNGSSGVGGESSGDEGWAGGLGVSSVGESDFEDDGLGVGSARGPQTAGDKASRGSPERIPRTNSLNKSFDGSSSKRKSRLPRPISQSRRQSPLKLPSNSFDLDSDDSTAEQTPAPGSVRVLTPASTAPFPGTIPPRWGSEKKTPQQQTTQGRKEISGVITSNKDVVALTEALRKSHKLLDNATTEIEALQTKLGDADQAIFLLKQEKFEAQQLIDALRGMLSDSEESQSVPAIVSVALSGEAVPKWQSYELTKSEMDRLLKLWQNTEAKLQNAILTRDEFERSNKKLIEDVSAMHEELANLHQLHKIQCEKYEHQLLFSKKEIEAVTRISQFNLASGIASKENNELLAISIQKIGAEKKIFELSVILDSLKERYNLILSKLLHDLNSEQNAKAVAKHRVDELLAELQIAEMSGTDNVKKLRSECDLAAATQTKADRHIIELTAEIETVKLESARELAKHERELIVAKEELQKINATIEELQTQLKLIEMQSNENDALFKELESTVNRQLESAINISLSSDALEADNASSTEPIDTTLLRQNLLKAQDTIAELNQEVIRLKQKVAEFEKAAEDRKDKEDAAHAMLVKVTEMGSSLKFASERLMMMEARHNEEQETMELQKIVDQEYIDSLLEHIAEIKALFEQKCVELAACQRSVEERDASLTTCASALGIVGSELNTMRVLLDPTFSPLPTDISSSVLPPFVSKLALVVQELARDTLASATDTIQEFVSELEKYNEVSELGAKKISDLEREAEDLRQENEQLHGQVEHQHADIERQRLLLMAQVEDASGGEESDRETGKTRDANSNPTTDSLLRLHEAKVEVLTRQLEEIKASNKRLEALLAATDFVAKGLQSFSGVRNVVNDVSSADLVAESEGEVSPRRKSVSFSDCDQFEPVGRVTTLSINTTAKAKAPSLSSPRGSSSANSAQLLADLTEMSVRYTDLVRVNIGLQQTATNAEKQFNEAAERLMLAVDENRSEQRRQVEEVVRKFKKLKTKYDKLKLRTEAERHEYEDIIVELYHQLGVENPDLPAHEESNVSMNTSRVGENEGEEVFTDDAANSIDQHEYY